MATPHTSAAVSAQDGIEVESVSDRTLRLHRGGKLEIASRVPLKTPDDLSMAYTPGVARACRAIADDPELVWSLTSKANAVAIVTDGTAVLGLGNIGPEAALPVMEGKAILFKEFAGVDAWPICLATTDPDEIVRAVAAIAPGFGGINLEDIAAPRCFEIEARLRELLDIPVLHDDQHGTAIVVLAALQNALRVVDKRLEDARIVVTGAGAAGTATARMLAAAGAGEIIVFAMANPTPEIAPEEIEGLVAVMGTGRSDYPNQINNVLAFPGVFRGALHVRATAITEGMKIAAARALADVVPRDHLAADYVLPSVLDRRVAPAIADAVALAASAEGVARSGHG